MRNQKKNAIAAAMFACAHQGVARGEPMKVICAQSKVRTDIPSPEAVPKSWLTTMFSGAIQQIQLNVERAVKRYPGRK